MPHVPIAPPMTRLFGRIDRFHCECPNCGALIVSHLIGGGGAGALKRRRKALYNPILSLARCPDCRSIFGVGLLLWTYRPGSGPHRIPPDHKPTARQRAELRQYLVSGWGLDRREPDDELNYAIDADCTCQKNGWRTDCPVHRWEWEDFYADQAEIDEERKKERKS